MADIGEMRSDQGGEGMIRCNWCMKTFTSEDDLAYMKDGDETYRGCPFCLTDEYLMDIEDEEGEE